MPHALYGYADAGMQNRGPMMGMKEKWDTGMFGDTRLFVDLNVEVFFFLLWVNGHADELELDCYRGRSG